VTEQLASMTATAVSLIAGVLSDLLDACAP
jgi:hypothetical protein